MAETGFAKSSISVFGLRVGIAVAEFVGVLYVARVVGASAFGTYALFAAVVYLSTLFTDLGVSEATKKRISETRYDSEAHLRLHERYFAASLLLRLAFFTPVVLLIALFRDVVALYIGTGIALPFIIAAVLVIVLQESFSAVLAGEKRVARSVLLPFVDSVGRVVTWIMLTTLGFGLVGLLWGFLVGQLLALLLGLLLLPIWPATPNRADFGSLLRFAKFSWLGSIKETSWVWTDTLVLGLFVASTLIGVYEISWQISSVFFFVGSAVSTALLPNVSELWTNGNRERIEELVEFSLVYTGIIAIPGFVGTIFVGPHLLYFFGEEFLGGYLVLLILILARVIHNYEIILEKLVHALDRPDLMFRANLVFIVLTFALNILFVALIGWWAAALATSLSMLVKTLLVYLYASSLLTISVPTREIASQIVAAIVMGVVLFFLPVTFGDLLALVFAIAVGICIYVLSLLSLSTYIRHDALNII